MSTCKKCGATIEPDEERIINEKTDSAYPVCESCFESMWDKDEITKCEGCGNWYEYDKLESEGEVGGDSFVPCPSCGRDIVDGLTREERLTEELEPASSWAVTCVYNDHSVVKLLPSESQARTFLAQSFDTLAVAAKAQYGDGCTTAIYPEFSRAFVCCKLQDGKENRTEFYCSQVQP